MNSGCHAAPAGGTLHSSEGQGQHLKEVVVFSRCPKQSVRWQDLKIHLRLNWNSDLAVSDSKHLKPTRQFALINVSGQLISHSVAQ